MLITCWSAKGGCGATTVASALALSLAESTGAPVTLVDLAGDLPVALGMPEPVGPGVSDWLAAFPNADRARLDASAVRLHGDVALVPLGAGPLRAGAAMEALAAVCAAGGRLVVADAGTLGPGHPALGLVAGASRSLLVTRPCYLAIRRALTLAVRPDAVVLVGEPGRAFGRADVEAVLGVPVAAEIPHDPAVARALDAGLLLSRLPRSLRRAVRDAA